MNGTSARALSVARPIIQGLTILNILYAVGIASLLGTSFFLEGWPWKPLGFEQSPTLPYLSLGLSAIGVIGVIGAAIVDTVRSGDLFIVENARRLDAIAWSVLGLEVLRMCVLAIAAAASLPIRLGGISLAPWLAVLMLFVLSGVFAHGARLRADLEGTV